MSVPGDDGEKRPYRRSDLPDRRKATAGSVESGGHPGAHPDSEMAAAFLRSRIHPDPEVFVVLGSGLSGVADAVEDPSEVGFEEVPGLPSAAVAGHPGRFVSGRLGGRRVLVQLGRHHLYEGHPPGVVQAPVRIAAALGARIALLTNSSGGIAPGLEPGCVAVIQDHLDFQRRSEGARRRTSARRTSAARPIDGIDRPGEAGGGGTLFDPHLSAIALAAAREMGIALSSAVYACVLGPTYETPAEIRLMRAAGAGLVGMSTIPEARAAKRAGMSILGLSFVANRAAGLAPEPLTHEAVMRAGREGGEVMSRLIPGILERLGR